MWIVTKTTDKIKEGCHTVKVKFRQKSNKVKNKHNCSWGRIFRHKTLHLSYQNITIHLKTENRKKIDNNKSKLKTSFKI